MLAVCGGGGDDNVAIAVILGAVLLWAFVAALLIRAGRDGSERLVLASLLMFSILIGPLIYFGVAGGFAGDNDAGRFVLALLVPGAIGAGLALLTRGAHGFRAFLVSSWGALFLIGGFYALLVAFFGFGTACLD